MYYDTYVEFTVITLIIASVLLPCFVYVYIACFCKIIENKILKTNGEQIQKAIDDIFEYLGEKAYIKNEYYYFDLCLRKSRSIVEKVPYREMYYFNKYVVKESQFEEYIIPLYRELKNVEIIYKNAIRQKRKVYSIINELYQGNFARDQFTSKIFQSLIGIPAKDICPISFEFEFSYVSPRGQSSLSNYISIDKDFLKNYIEYDQALKEKNTFNYSERNKLTPALRTKIFERDNYTCCYCGASLSNGRTDELHCDHIYPIVKGGITRANNLQTLCKNCNLNKGDKWREVDKIAYMKRNNGNLPE